MGWSPKPEDSKTFRTTVRRQSEISMSCTIQQINGLWGLTRASVKCSLWRLNMQFIARPFTAMSRGLRGHVHSVLKMAAQTEWIAKIRRVLCIIPSLLETFTIRVRCHYLAVWDFGHVAFG